MIDLLQYHIRNRLPYAGIVFSHVIESLVFVPIMVGMLFFLFEFFKDQLLAFFVLSIVWLCELFSVVSLRTRLAIMYYPRLFLCYFALFHIYFFSYPFGFSYSALLTTVLFLLVSDPSLQYLAATSPYSIPCCTFGTIVKYQLWSTESYPLLLHAKCRSQRYVFPITLFKV